MKNDVIKFLQEKSKEPSNSRKLKISFSAGTLLDMAEADEIFYTESHAAFYKYLNDMMERGEIFGPGPGLAAYKSLKVLAESIPKEVLDIEFSLITRMPVDYPVFWESYEHHIIEGSKYYNEFSRLSFGQQNIVGAQLASSTDLAFVTSEETAKDLHKAGIAAMYIPNISPESNAIKYENAGKPITFIYDYDGVLADEKSEEVFQNAKKEGLVDPVKAFSDHEIKNINKPMGMGPMGEMLKKLSPLVRANRESIISGGKPIYPIKVAIVTARGGISRKRLLDSLRYHDMSVDELHMRSGSNKIEPIALIASTDENLCLYAEDSAVWLNEEMLNKDIISGLVINSINKNKTTNFHKKPKKKSP